VRGYGTGDLVKQQSTRGSWNKGTFNDFNGTVILMRELSEDKEYPGIWADVIRSGRGCSPAGEILGIRRLVILSRKNFREFLNHNIVVFDQISR